jgi:hypothetical protein
MLPNRSTSPPANALCYRAGTAHPKVMYSACIHTEFRQTDACRAMRWASILLRLHNTSESSRRLIRNGSKENCASCACNGRLLLVRIANSELPKRWYKSCLRVGKYTRRMHSPSAIGERGRHAPHLVPAKHRLAGAVLASRRGEAALPGVPQHHECRARPHHSLMAGGGSTTPLLSFLRACGAAAAAAAGGGGGARGSAHTDCQQPTNTNSKVAADLQKVVQA